MRTRKFPDPVRMKIRPSLKKTYSYKCIPHTYISICWNENFNVNKLKTNNLLKITLKQSENLGRGFLFF